MPSKPTQEERIAAAWPSGLPPGLQRKIERAQDEKELAALTEEMAERGDRIVARRAEKALEDPEPVVAVVADKEEIVFSIEGMDDVRLTERQAKQLRKMLNEKGI